MAYNSEAFSDPSRTSRIDIFAKIVNRFQPIFAKSSILAVNYFRKKLHLRSSTVFWISLYFIFRSVFRISNIYDGALSRQWNLKKISCCILIFQNLYKYQCYFQLKFNWRDLSKNCKFSFCWKFMYGVLNFYTSNWSAIFSRKGYCALLIQHYLVQNWKWKHQNNVWNLLKVNNKDTKRTSMALS